MKIPFFSRSAKSRNLEAQTRALNAYADQFAARSFNAAAVDRLVSDWKWDGGFTNTEVLGALCSLRARSRDMAKNSPMYARYIQLMRENVVGDGFRFKSLPAASMDDPERLDADAARFIEYHWWRWAKNPYFVDSAKRLDLTQFLALAVENWVRDGEAFIVMDRVAQNKYGLSLRLIRADCIDETVNFKTKNGAVVRGGIEYNAETGEPVAYYFNGNGSDSTTVFLDGKMRVRIPSRFVIHLYERHEADQTRGVPLGYSALLQLKMLDEYTKAELTAARDEACTVGAFTCPAGQDGAAEMDADTANKFRSKVEAGQKLFLPEGWKYDVTTPQHPNRGWVEFSVGLQRMISTGLGVDFSELTGNGSDTISAVARQSMMRTREMYKDRQRTVISLFLDRVWFAWLRSFLALRVSGKYGEADFERLSDHTFQGRRWGWIDPTAEVNAATVATAHGWRTDAEVAAEYGNDIDDNIAEAARIKDAKASAGLITVGQGLNAKPPEDPEKADADDAEKAEEKPKTKTKARAKRKIDSCAISSGKKKGD